MSIIIEQLKELQAELTRLEGDVQRKRTERARLNDEVQAAKEKVTIAKGEAQAANDEVQAAKEKVTIVKDKLEFFSSLRSEYEIKFNAFIVEPFKTGGVLGDDIKSFADSCGFEFFDDEPEADEAASG